MTFSEGVPRKRTRVLIIDDTRTIRSMIRALLADDQRLEVVGEAVDPYMARDMIKALQPDVLTLDVEMPRMNGLVFLDKLMRLRPMPVVMVSTRTAEQSDDAVRALALGAIDCVDLRRLKSNDPRMPPLGDTLVAAAAAKPKQRKTPPPEMVATPAKPGETYRWNGRHVLIGSSTGGVDALLTVLGGFPSDCPPTLIAQHMPHHFLKSFAARLNTHTAPEVRLATDGAVLKQGVVMLAPGGEYHAEILDGEIFRVRLRRDLGEDLYVPSVARLFGSAVASGERIVAVMLTGMGRDGAREMRALRDAGAITLAQSGPTCVVDGMPRAAREAGGVIEVVDLDGIAARVLRHTGDAVLGVTT